MSRIPRATHPLLTTLTLLPVIQSSNVIGIPPSLTPEAEVASSTPHQPLEQLISESRRQYGNLVVHSARLTQQNKTLVYVIDFTNSKQQWIRTVYDTNTGRLISKADLKTPMSLEKSLTIIHKIHPGKNLIRSWLERRNGELVRVFELADPQHKRYEVIQDAYTGQLITEKSYNLKPNGKELSLNEILKKAREKHKGMIVLQTRSTIKNNTKIREIIYLDENRIRRKMIVNAITGELVEDKITPWVQI